MKTEMKDSMKGSLRECKEYTSTIMTSISSILSDNKIKFESNAKHTEFVIFSSEKKVRNILEKKLDVPKKVTSLLLSISSETNKKTYVRLNFN